MCRWIAYRGETTALEDYVTEPAHSLIAQSIHAMESTASVNGDGFGLGWYGKHPEPGLYREIRPAWSDENLRYLCRHLQIAPVLRPCSRCNRHRNYARQLSSVRLRKMAVYAQRFSWQLELLAPPYRSTNSRRALSLSYRDDRFGSDFSCDLRRRHSASDRSCDKNIGEADGHRPPERNGRSLPLHRGSHGWT